MPNDNGAFGEEVPYQPARNPVKPEFRPEFKKTPKNPEVQATEKDVEKLGDITGRIESVRAAIKKTEGLARLLDNKFLDPIVGLVLEALGLPIIGDIPTTIASLYIIGEAKKAGLPASKIAKMLWNVGVDFAVDLIPIFGNVADFFIKANVKNLEIMKKYADELELKKQA